MCKKLSALPPGDIALPLQLQKRPAPWSYSSSKFISTPNFRDGADIMYHCIPPGKPEYALFQ